MKAYISCSQGAKCPCKIINHMGKGSIMDSDDTGESKPVTAGVPMVPMIMNGSGEAVPPM